MTSPTPEIDLPARPHSPTASGCHYRPPGGARAAVARQLLTEDFLTLPRRVDKLQGEFEEFREETRAGFRAVNDRIDATNAEVRTLSGQLDATNEEVHSLSSEVRTLGQRMDENTRTIRRLDGHVGRLIGNAYEDKCRYNIGVILDGWLDGPVVADRAPINTKLLDARRNGAISREEYEDGLNPDIIARGVEDTDQIAFLAIVEVSVTFNQDDLETAARRAAVIAKVTGTGTAAFMATHFDWPDEVNAVAHTLGVTIIRFRRFRLPVYRIAESGTRLMQPTARTSSSGWPGCGSGTSGALASAFA